MLMGLMRTVEYRSEANKLVEKLIHDQCRQMQLNCFRFCKKYKAGVLPENCGYKHMIRRLIARRLSKIRQGAGSAGTP
jgi:hypothetical protein